MNMDQVMEASDDIMGLAACISFVYSSIEHTVIGNVLEFQHTAEGHSLEFLAGALMKRAKELNGIIEALGARE